jgi:hypothetical protein
MNRFSVRFRFADWPNRNIPVVAAGVYVIWNEETLVYCGMSGRGIEQAVESSRPKYGLVTRLATHASGRLSGDQFSVYLANRIIIPSLQTKDLGKFESGELRLDSLVRTFVRDRLEYQYAIVDSTADAFQLERQCRSGEVFGIKPYLNPA